MNEVVNGFFVDGRAIAPTAALAVVPLGSGSDFCRSFGIGPSPELALDRIAGNRVQTIDLATAAYAGRDGGACERIFANIASFGISGVIVEAMAAARGRFRLGAAFAYRVATLRALFTWPRPRVVVSIDGAELELRATVVAVCNGTSFGAGLRIAPKARCDDGLFDVVMLHDVGALDFLANVGRLSRGELDGHPKHRASRGRFVSARPIDPGVEVPLELDGEAVGRLPASFTVLPAALRLHV